MSTATNTIALSVAARNAAYTGARTDIVDMIPTSVRQILDVGCSNGATGRALKADDPSRSVCGIEYNAEFARQAAQDLDFVVHGDLNVLDWREALGDRKFDCIIFADVLEHIVSPQQCLQQAKPFLLPGGTIVVSLPNIRHVSALSSIFLKGSFPQRDRGIFDRTHLRWFTMRDGKEMLTTSGFKVSATSQVLRWGDIGGGRINKALNRLPRALADWAPIREFFTYQFCLRAELIA
jgi:2-polyprenyl-3-methyl-5-hydroxy-6-metoxy-1,4-benzoquinol methylase